MRAFTLQGKAFRVAELPDPSPATGQILVRPLFTGICGSDLSLRKQMAALLTPHQQRRRTSCPSSCRATNSQLKSSASVRVRRPA